jgi:methylenetetrahydrofolate reductase (NADPH)
MHLSTIYQNNNFVLSYELFPPKTEQGLINLDAHLSKLLAYNPHFITCTYGAGGSTRDRTLTTLKAVRSLTDIPIASHLTCVQATADEIQTYVQKAVDLGVSNIVAIRGDIPQSQESFEVTEGGFAYANELVGFLHQQFPELGIAVGGYPEKHPEAVSLEEDIDYLKQKVDAGADIIVTQLFYNNDAFYRYRDKCVAAGISISIVPGIMPVTSFKQITRLTELSGSTLPENVTHELEQHQVDADAQFNIGMNFAIEQCRDLIKQGVPGLHFYVLNKSEATTTVLKALHPLY